MAENKFDTRVSHWSDDLIIFFGPIWLFASIFLDWNYNWQSMPRAGAVIVLCAVLLQFKVYKRTSELTIQVTMSTIGGLAGILDQWGETKVPKELSQMMANQVEADMKADDRETYNHRINLLSVLYAAVGTLIWGYGELLYQLLDKSIK